MTDSADLPLDDEDEAILDRLAAIHGLLDPPPANLDERVRFAIALDEVDMEVARLGEDLPVGSGTRSGDRTRTITFDGESRTVMIMIADRPDGLVRLDGWLAPPAVLRVELRLPPPAPSQTVLSDDAGRFVFDGIPHGLAQLVVHPPEDGTAPRVVTPSLAL
ncbi:MAG TPA: hypothetical protein VE776_03995 [Actinomycetota bacterium]|nr:hypothetical protein [Actinomycetota bacterium]